MTAVRFSAPLAERIWIETGQDVIRYLAKFVFWRKESDYGP